MPVKHLIAVGFNAFWQTLSDAGNWLVFGFGMLLSGACVVALLHFGIGEMFPNRYRRAKEKRRNHHKWSTQR